jgi:hypothetical protein
MMLFKKHPNQNQTKNILTTPQEDGCDLFFVGCWGWGVWDLIAAGRSEGMGS